MIICRTPFRISFFGGGTDYPAWYRENGGAVLSSSIDKYCYLTCRYLPPFFEHKIRLVYSKIEMCNSSDEISHPSVKEVLRHLKFDRGVEIHHDGDLPARSGMGSSSAFTVGLLNALYALQGKIVSKQQLANESIHIEQERIGEVVGSQDQVAVAHGGLNHIGFAQNGEISVTPVTIGHPRLNLLDSHLMLFYTGIRRTAEHVARSYVDKIMDRRTQLNAMKGMVGEALALLNSERDICEFGKLMHEAWTIKKSFSNDVSNDDVDDLYAKALAAGALGGKLTGAGGGGFLLLFVPPERQKAVRASLCSLIHVPFHLEFQGSQIIFYDPQIDYSTEEKERGKMAIRNFRELSQTKVETRA